jgi:hypothetical protein
VESGVFGGRGIENGGIHSLGKGGAPFEGFLFATAEIVGEGRHGSAGSGAFIGGDGALITGG